MCHSVSAISLKIVCCYRKRIQIPMNSTTPVFLTPDNNARNKSSLDPRTGWDVFDLLLILARSKRFILIFTGSVTVVVAVYTMLLPLRYTADTSFIPPQQSSSSSALLSQVSGLGSLSSLAGGSLGIKNPADLYIAMIRSRTVEDAMIRRFDLLREYKAKKMSDARTIFEQRSTAVAGTKDNVIRVAMEASSPQSAAEMANAYVDELRKLAATMAVTEAAQRRLFFDNQLTDAKDKLVDAEEDLKKTELATGMVQPDSQSRAMIESAATIQGQIVAKQVQLESMTAYATNDNPEVVTIQRQLAELRLQLQHLTGNANTDTDIFLPKGKIPAAALDYVRKLREVKYREVIFQAIAHQFEMAKLDEARQGSVIQVIDSAVPPDKRSFPKRTILVVLATLLAFFFSCTFVLLKHRVASFSSDQENKQKITELRSILRKRPS